MINNETKLNLCPREQWKNIIPKNIDSQEWKDTPSCCTLRAELPEIRTQGTKLSEQVSSLQLDRALTTMALLSLLGKDIRMQLGTTLFFK